MSASPPRQASQKKRKRQVVQSEDEDEEPKTSEPNVEASTPPGWQTNTEKRPAKRSKPKLRTPVIRSSKRGKKAPLSDAESDSAEVETQDTEADHEPTGKTSSKSTTKEKAKEKDPDEDRVPKKPRLTAGEKLKRQTSNASVKSAKKAPNVGASGSGHQTPAKPPLPVGEKKTTGVTPETVGRPALLLRVYDFEYVHYFLTEGGSSARYSCINSRTGYE
jgi:hypothetical protein